MSTVKNTKPVRLRAFRFENDLITETNNQILSILTQKLSNTTAQERRMSLNSEEKAGEEDLISYYEPRNGVAIMGIVLRIAPSNESHTIPDNLFDKNKIGMTELENFGNKADSIEKDHYYFYLNNKYVITTLRSNSTINRFQVYLNWLLKDERKNKLYEISPVIAIPNTTKLNEIKSISFTDTSIHSQSKANIPIGTGTIKTTIRKTALEGLKNLFVDTKSFEEIKDSQILTAEILIKFVRPKGMKKEDFNKFMAATLKPVSDCDNVVLKTRNKGTLSGRDIQKSKTVEIELTESNNLNEQDLWQNMEKFVNELDQEDTY